MTVDLDYPGCLNGEALGRTQPVNSGHLTGFGFLSWALVAFFVVNITVFAMVSAYPPLRDPLLLTPSQPSGIVTAQFTHRDINHLVSNLAGFAILGLFFVGVNISADFETRRRLSKIFGFGSIIGGIAASAIQFSFWNVSAVSGIKACGASGVVYGAAGVLLVAALYNLPRCISQVRSAWRERLGTASANIFYAAAFSMCVAALFTYQPIFETGSFFYMSEETVWSCHALGFLLGSLVSVLLFTAIHFSKNRGRAMMQHQNLQAGVFQKNMP
jgi:membrane associated rhomboid family serine protease